MSGNVFFEQMVTLSKELTPYEDTGPGSWLIFIYLFVYLHVPFCPAWCMPLVEEMLSEPDPQGEDCKMFTGMKWKWLSFVFTSPGELWHPFLCCVGLRFVLVQGRGQFHFARLDEFIFASLHIYIRFFSKWWNRTFFEMRGRIAREGTWLYLCPVFANFSSPPFHNLCYD